MRRQRCGGALLLLLCAFGCAAPVRRKDAVVFFPPLPALPRVQFLTSFSGSNDIETQSAFSRFVVGEKKNVKLGKPYGIAVHNGRLYVCDTLSTVVVFDFNTKTFGTLQGAVGAGELRQPINIAIDADGTKYVADPVRGQVVVFDRNDQFLRGYGTPGAWRPVDAIPFDGKLYVADAEQRLVKVLDLETGELIRTIGDQGDPSERLDRPTNLAVDHDGNLYVTDASRFQVVKFDRDGRFLATIGKAGDNLGHFARPKGLAFDREGRLYAVDAAFNQVQIFDRSGRLLMHFGGGGQGPGAFVLPAKVIVDYDSAVYFQEFVEPGFQVDYVVFVTSQFGERLINVLAFGKDPNRNYPSDDELQRQIEERREAELGKNRTSDRPDR